MSVRRQAATAAQDSGKTTDAHQTVMPNAFTKAGRQQRLPSDTRRQRHSMETGIFQEAEKARRRVWYTGQRGWVKAGKGSSVKYPPSTGTDCNISSCTFPCIKNAPPISSPRLRPDHNASTSEVSHEGRHADAVCKDAAAANPTSERRCDTQALRWHEKRFFVRRCADDADTELQANAHRQHYRPCHNTSASEVSHVRHHTDSVCKPIVGASIA